MELPKRKSPRLKDFDYASENYYFITICTYEKKNIFGTVNGINDIGRVAEKQLLKLPEHFSSARIDRYVIMPNHIHAIVIIKSADIRLQDIVGQYKSGVTREVHKLLPELKVWQRSFYDHVIRNDDEYIRVSKYIDENRLKLKCLMNGSI